MSKSRRFKTLLSRLATLEKHFLPKISTPPGQYSAREYDLTKAYVLLVHAEIEAYLEDRGKDRVRKLERAWATSGRRSKWIRRLIHTHNQMNKQPWQPVDWSTARVNSAINSYIGSIDANHGIKEKNVCQIMYPIGMEYASLNVTWLANMNSFGTYRGSLAHSSIKTHQPIAPEDAQAKVEEIVKGLAKLDRKIRGL
jgi:hypothetical protein